jgi:GNAT superfamily N-acetyltransferase
MHISIEKLNENTLQEAENLKDKVFERSESSEAFTLRASLNPKKYQKIYKDNFIDWMEYYVAKINNKVVGIIGLYTENDEDNKTCWLGWFAVEPKFRGFKIGKKLLNFAIDEAKEREFETLKVYTYELKNYLTAIDLYKKEGFEIIESDKKTKLIVLEKKIPYFKYKFEKNNVGMLVEVTPKRILKVIENEPFAIVSANKKEFSNDENKKRNKKLLKDLRKDLKNLDTYPLIGHWKKNKIDFIERSLLIKKPKNMSETEFFDIIKKYNQNNFIFKGNKYKFAIYDKNGDIEVEFNENKKNSVNIAFKKSLELENYFENDTIFETFFHLPKDNISGARAFPKEYDYTITLHHTMEIIKEK